MYGTTSNRNRNKQSKPPCVQIVDVRHLRNSVLIFWEKVARLFGIAKWPMDEAEVQIVELQLVQNHFDVL